MTKEISMPPETLAALDASIAKWDRIAESGDRASDIGSDTCPLCKIMPLDCEGCPVSAATGKSQCVDTPWRNASRERWGLRLHRTDDPTAFRAAAREEALFLRAIRPIGIPTPPQGGER